MTDKPEPAPVTPRQNLSSQGLRMPANFRDVTYENAGRMFAIIGYPRQPAPDRDEAPAPTPAPSPAPPERK
jgi:hypothetical protein